MIAKIVKHLKIRWAQTSSDRYVDYLRKNNIKIGHNAHFVDPRTMHIDLTRPSLIEIGDNVFFTSWCSILTHDFTTRVFCNLYDDLLPSAGKVIIGNNVYFNQRCTVLKNVTIGDNCILGYASTITKDIPANSVAVGTPAKVICTVEEYYKKRREKFIEEAFIYARSIKERYGRMPVIEDFWEEFPLFINGNETDKYPMINYKKQLGNALKNWKQNHKAPFKSFEEFLKAAGIE